MGRGKVALAFAGAALLAQVACAGSAPEKTFSLDREKDGKQAHYLEDVIAHEYDRSQIVWDVRNVGEELFTLSFSSYAFLNLAFRDSSFVPEARASIKQAIDRVLLLNSQGIAYAAVSEMSQENLLYVGHLNLMLGAYALAGGDGEYATLHKDLTDQLSDRVGAAPIKNLETYPDKIYPADNAVVLASLQVYDLVYRTDYDVACAEWVSWMKNNGLDDKTGLMASRIASTGELIDGPRGCALSWSVIFVNMFDPSFAGDQYRLYKEKMGRNFGPIYAFKERPGDWTIGSGDIDSGPIFLGYSVAATGIGLGAAMIENDDAAGKIFNLIRLIDGGKEDEDTFHYRHFTPLSDALLLFCKTMTSWDDRYVHD